MEYDTMDYGNALPNGIPILSAIGKRSGPGPMVYRQILLWKNWMVFWDSSPQYDDRSRVAEQFVY